jgi:hypothetical protein
MAEDEYRLVYSGFDPTLAGMLARMLEAEGIECRHIGSQHPAALGVGELVCEQKLEVPEQDESRARELIEASTSESAS